MTNDHCISIAGAEQTFVSDRERLIDLALRIVDSRAVAEEIVQESWIRWHGKEYAQAEAGPIFRRIVSNLAKDWRRSRTAEQVALSEIYERRNATPSTETAVIARNELSIIVRTLLSMSDRHVRAFRMRMIEGRTYKEIGQALGLSVSHSHKLIEQVMVEIYFALDG
ncbi:RNA polymerase sigma factor [Thalassococcus sp. S3]|uniref:RNA polymerase sigma factor n=1 Tax=Thalassococcus sp. S3 TaxID=2017482 RepID=UPI0013EE437E|nr:sigma-70 family RNA polymerase sigma factor [Thalassococcus sp. S3]